MTAITISTYGDLARYGYRLNVFCRACQRHVTLDPAMLPAGRSYINDRYRCRQCGSSRDTSGTIAPGGTWDGSGAYSWAKGKD
ncbi:hypothetical protein [Rhizobium sp. PAMB 3182]